LHTTLLYILQLTLLSQFRLTLLDRADKHVTTTSSGKSVKATLNVADGNDVQVLGARVIGTVHDGTNGQTESHTVLSSGNANCIEYVSFFYGLFNKQKNSTYFSLSIHPISIHRFLFLGLLLFVLSRLGVFFLYFFSLFFKSSNPSILLYSIDIL
jgi:hypothetical protein